MRIGIDISQIVYEGTGVARFTQGLVEAILRYDNKNQWLFFFSSLRRNLNEDLEKKIIQKGHQLIKWRLPPTLLSFLFNDLHRLFQIPDSRFQIQALDWFITSDWTEPAMKINKATVVHDLVYLRYPETVAKKIRLVQEKRLNLVKKEAKIIFADSQTSKNDLVELLEINPEKIKVNYPGVEVLKPTKEQIATVLTKYKIKKPFILTVGKIEPRKNLSRLIQAFQQCNNVAIDLVVVGPSGWGDSRFQIPDSRFKFLGYINDEELYSLYSSCLFFIYPSLWEGFGYPIVEAMKLDVAVACSNTSSIKEIAADAALLFNPQDIDDISEKIKTMLEDEKLRKQLIAKGRERSRIFTWRTYYEKLIKAFYDYRS